MEDKNNLLNSALLMLDGYVDLGTRDQRTLMIQSRKSLLELLELSRDSILTQEDLHAKTNQTLLDLFELLTQVSETIRLRLLKDRLTGLGTRYEFDIMFDVFFKDYQEINQKFSLCLMEIDNRRELGKHDNYGDSSVNAIFRSFAILLKEFFGDKFILLKLGMDKFAVMGQVNEEDMLQLIKEFQNYFYQNQTLSFPSIEGYKISLSFSAGISSYNLAFSQHDLYSTASTNLLSAKKQGGDLIATNKYL